MKVEITLYGRDDETIFEMNLSPQKLKFLKEVEELANKNSYCIYMPIMKVKEIK